VGTLRLSALQKWILVNCYNVTVLKNYTAIKPLNDCQRNHRPYFWRYDVFLSWFKLEKSSQCGFLRPCRIKATKDYYTAQAILQRTLKSLFFKGYIKDPRDMQIIELEAAGEEKARELLKLYV